MGNQELLATLTRIKELEIEQAKLSEELESLKDRVKAEMVTQGVSRIQVGLYRVSYTKYQTHRFDSQRFKAENESLYQSYLKAVEASRLTIK